MSTAETPATDWRDRPITRLAGSAASWFLFSLSFTLLAFSAFAVMTLGGSCASGGPYDVAVQCPDNVVAYTPLSIFGGLFAVAISIFLAQGFGTPLITWAWPILFCGLGAIFLLAFVLGQDIVGLLIGLMFEVMGLFPLVIEFRGSPQRVFLGQRALSGARFYEGERARRSLLSPTAPNPEGAVPPVPIDWVLSISIVATMALAGYSVARTLFGG